MCEHKDQALAHIYPDYYMLTHPFTVFILVGLSKYNYYFIGGECNEPENATASIYNYTKDRSTVDVRTI